MSNRSQGSDTRRAWRFYLAYFTEHPDASIDAAAKAACAANEPAINSIAAKVRRQVREGAPQTSQPVVIDNPPKKSFVSPAEWSAPKPGLLPPTPQLEEPAQEKPMAVAPVPVDINTQKQRYVDDQLTEDPSLRPQVLMGRLIERFGTGTSHEYVYESCRAARELHGLEPIPTKERMSRPRFEGAADEVLTEHVRDFVRQLKAAGLQLERFTLTVNGEWEVEFSAEQKVINSGKLKL